MKIETGKSYYTSNGILVTIIATDPLVNDIYKFIGTNATPSSKCYYNYARDGSLCASNDSTLTTQLRLVSEYRPTITLPEHEKPIFGTPYYYPHITSPAKNSGCTWSDDYFDNQIFDDGILYLNKSDAISASDIILKVFREHNDQINSK